MRSDAPCRTFIIFRHALFAQGVRSLLEPQRGVQIVGMDEDLARATEAARALRPDVILVEESLAGDGMCALLHASAASRIVIVSLNHGLATVYERHRTAVAGLADLAAAITGTRAHDSVPSDGFKGETSHG